MIITPKQPRNDKTSSRLSRLVPYRLRGKGEERYTWYMAGNLPGHPLRPHAPNARQGSVALTTTISLVSIDKANP
jgi:hypothetical protein